ncbi:ATP synthase subunit K, mitochondrial [[Candida] anglica]|uniref:ATP synthase subunit K, mitochondrial n=1 Tax=[Candida] anglica TaxID=148631 RepID=A0ABP0EF61_9ASCO
MGSAYTILGKQVPSHVLALLTLGATAGVVAWPRAAKEAPVATPAAVPAVKEDDFDLEKLLSDFTKEESK